MTMTTRRSVQSAAAAAAESQTEVAKVCCFCGLSEDNEFEYGKFYEHRGIITHYYCLLLSSNMEQKGKDNEGILGFLAQDIQKELRRGRRLNCSYCKKNGATLGCCNVRCKKIFHLPCGLRNGSLHQFFGEFKSFCTSHRPQQKIDERIRQESQTTEEKLCYICYDEVNTTDNLHTLWAPCCKKNAWFHRLCVQQLAMSAGYFFKCPLCNSKKEFQTAMLEYGIFIPCQDASWELVPNAYEELLYRHNRCDAITCLCPKGRTHISSNAKWELALCRLCGSQGIHMACGQLKWANPTWECVECTSIITKSTSQSPRKSSIERKNAADASYSDSDSDISVGKSEPIQHTGSIRLKPGPRSFKLLQARLAIKSINKTHGDNAGGEKSLNLTGSESGSSSNNNEPQSSVIETKYIKQSISPIKSDNDSKSQSSNKNSEEVIMIESDDDDAIEIVSEKITKKMPEMSAKSSVSQSTSNTSNVDSVSENAEETKVNIKTSPAQVDATERLPADNVSTLVPNNVDPNAPSSSTNVLTPLTTATEVQEFSPMILNVTSIPAELHAQLPNSGQVTDQELQKIPEILPNEIQIANRDLPMNPAMMPAEMLVPQNMVADINQSAWRRKRIHEMVYGDNPQTVEEIREIVEFKRRRVEVGNWAQNSNNTIISSILPDTGNDEFLQERLEANCESEVKLPRSVVLPSMSFKKEDMSAAATTKSIKNVLDNSGDNNNREIKYASNSEILNNDSRQCIIRQALKNAGIESGLRNFVSGNNINNNSLHQLTMNQPSTSSTSDIKLPQDGIPSTQGNVMYYVTNGTQICSDSTIQQQNCDGDAGTSPAVDPGHGTSTNSIPRGKRRTSTASPTPRKILRSHSGNVNTASASPSNNGNDSSDSNTSSTVFEPSCDRTGLMKSRVRLRDIKFHICKPNVVEITLYDKYKIDIKMDNTRRRKTHNSNGGRMFRSSKSKIKLKSNDGQQQSEESENPHYSADQQETNDSTKSKDTRLLTHLDDAKENFNPVIFGLDDDTALSSCEKRAPLSHCSPQNTEDPLHISPAKCTPTQETSTNWSNEEDNSNSSDQDDKLDKGCELHINCKVSIDLKKIKNLIGSSPNLFDKQCTDSKSEESIGSKRKVEMRRSHSLNDLKRDVESSGKFGSESTSHLNILESSGDDTRGGFYSDCDVVQPIL